jgi:hypothetical protein
MLLGGVGVLFLLIIIGRIVWGIVTVPTTADAFRLSVQAIRDRALSEAVSARPDACSIKGNPGFGWSVECLGIKGRTGSGCRSVWWTIDPWGVPSNPDGTGGRFASMGDECRNVR